MSGARSFTCSTQTTNLLKWFNQLNTNDNIKYNDSETENEQIGAKLLVFKKTTKYI